MRVTAADARGTSATTRARRSSSGRAPDGARRPQRGRQDEPPRGDLLRLHRRARRGPRNDRELVRRGADDGARDRVDRRPRTAPPTCSRWGSTPGDGEVAAGRRRGLWTACRAAPARPLLERLPARAPRAGEGRARRAGAPTSTSLVAALWPARAETRAALLARARPAQRAARPDPRRRRRRPTRSTPGTPSWPATGVRADGRPRARPSALLAPLFAGRAARARACPSEAGAGVPPALGRRRRGRASRRSCAERREADIERGFTAHGPHRDDLAPRARRRAPCAPTAPRASSGSRCWRCCSPSATCSPTERGRPPLMLLDDVMSELDSARRELLAELLRAEGPERADHHRARPRARRLGDPAWPWSTWRPARPGRACTRSRSGREADR